MNQDHTQHNFKAFVWHAVWLAFTSTFTEINTVLPGMILKSYRKAENTASVMQQRGYGNIIPRGIANPIPFKLNDLILLVIILSGYTLLNLYVTL